ncbi:MAG: sulfotransferase [Anaerolineales bacterium]
MSFNFRLFFEQVRQTFSLAEGSKTRLTLRRVGVLLFLFPVFILFKLLQVIGFALDDLLYRDHQQQELSSPVFIIGNPRSGTTFLHRLLAKDEHNFSTIRTWEIFFAPSIFQRKLVWAIQSIDQKLGGAVQSWLIRQEQKTWFNNHMHRVSLWEAEEDESLLLAIWESIFTSVFFPHPDLVRKYAMFDKGVPARERRRIMRFYRSCLRKHLYAHNSEKKFLSKNPAFSAKVASLYEFFPNAKIIYLVRNPLDTVPSLISWMTYQWSQFSDPADEYLYREYLVQLAKEWYEYPLEQLEKASPDSYEIVIYDELASDPKGVIKATYEKFGFEVSPEFEAALVQANAAARTYKSKHRYSLEKIGLTKRQLIRTFRLVIDRFGFDTSKA